MNFDRVAPRYRAAEFLLAGPTLQRMRTRHFGKLRTCRRILIAGEGHGRGLEAVLRVAPDAEITVLDSSVRMLEVARARVDRKGMAAHRVQWIHADVRRWQPEPAGFDAVITPFFLDCFTAPDVERVVARLADGVSDTGIWLLSDFCIPARGWRRWRARLIHAGMYLAFRLAVRLEAHRLTPPDPALRAAGFAVSQRATACGGLVHADLWARPNLKGEI